MDSVIMTLKNVNLILKSNNNKEPEKPKPIPRNNDRQTVDVILLDKVWIKIRHLEYSTEVPVLNRCRGRLPRNVCPHCMYLFYAQDLDLETPVFYTYRCYHCGAILKIFKQ